MRKMTKRCDMKDWIEEEEIKRLEKERDRNLAIHCDYVAAKFQRMIDKIKIKKEDNNLKIAEHERRTDNTANY